MDTNRHSSENFVRYALQIGALELVPEGRKLKSGRISPYFFNSALFNTALRLQELTAAYVGVCRGEVLRLIARSTKELVIYGHPYKGIPIAVSVATMMQSRWRDIGWAFSRKVEKDHGEGGVTVGYPMSGQQVFLVDDVMTTGASFKEALEVVHAAGGNPIGCAIAFDRQEKGLETELSAVQEFEKTSKLPVFSAANLQDLITVLQTTPNISKGPETLPKILEYRSMYGAK